MFGTFVPAIAACLQYEGGPPRDALEMLVQCVWESPPALDSPGLITLQQRITTLLPAGRDQIDLVYGGATKIKGYVFEAPKLPEIRGASALLDLIDTRGIQAIWADHGLDTQLIVFASGGGALAFAPAGQGPALAAAIERAYARQTLTANSVAVTHSFSLIELRYGRRPLDYWIDAFLADWGSRPNPKHTALARYYYPPDGVDPHDMGEVAARRRFFNRKTFGELVTLLATLASRRRESLGDQGGVRRDIPVYTLPPWAAKCESSGNRAATVRAGTPDQPAVSEASAIKLHAGQQMKRRGRRGWFSREFPRQNARDLPEIAISWEDRFLANEHVEADPHITKLLTRWRECVRDTPYYRAYERLQAEQLLTILPAQDVGEIGQASRPKGYIGLIYADGNNVGRRIARTPTPEGYRALSNDLDRASNYAVFTALARHLRPTLVRTDEDEPAWVHPFEIITIGGDDLLLIVPGSAALQIALTIGYEFEHELGHEHPDQPRTFKARYHGPLPDGGYDFAGYSPDIGLSAGVLIAPENTPIFFMRDLVEDLLKNAKKQAKKNAERGDGSGAIDFMVLKAIGMVTDDIATFRANALGAGAESNLRFTGRPYTWPELQGLLTTAQTLRQINFPRSQLYHLRERLLNAKHEGGVTASVLDYLYTRTSGLKPLDSSTLAQAFDLAWHYPARDIAPWITQPSKVLLDRAVGIPPSAGAWRTGYETIWLDLVEIYDFVVRAEQDLET